MRRPKAVFKPPHDTMASNLAHFKTLLKSAWTWAALAAALTLTWQALTVHANYGGHWDRLFRTGQVTLIPPDLVSTTVRDPGRDGYDGQFYRFIAHDPRLSAATWASLDAPVVRARRILVPLLAWLLAAGQQRWIDGAYILVIAAFIFGGVYWMARSLERRGRHPAWALFFLLIPATIVSIDRMTIDVALGALAAAFVYYVAAGRDKALWITLAAAGLVRETGLLLVAACVLPALFRRDFRKAALWTSAAIPALCWFVFLQGLAEPHASAPAVAADAAQTVVPHWAMPRLEWGILGRALDPPQYGLRPDLEAWAHRFDVTALLAMFAAAVLALARLHKAPRGPIRTALGLHAALLFALTNKDFWITAFGYSRPFAPLYVLLMGPSLGPAAFLSALVDLRLYVEIKAQVLGVLHWL
jgi:hypothetical protein